MSPRSFIVVVLLLSLAGVAHAQQDSGSGVSARDLDHLMNRLTPPPQPWTQASLGAFLRSFTDANDRCSRTEGSATVLIRFRSTGLHQIMVSGVQPEIRECIYRNMEVVRHLPLHHDYQVQHNYPVGAWATPPPPPSTAPPSAGATAPDPHLAYVMKLGQRVDQLVEDPGLRAALARCYRAHPPASSPLASIQLAVDLHHDQAGRIRRVTLDSREPISNELMLCSEGVLSQQRLDVDAPGRVIFLLEVSATPENH